MTFTRRVLVVPTAVFCSCFAVSAWGQQPKPLPLNHDQVLQIENDAKDVKLAQQDIELLKVQLAASLLEEQRSEQVFNAYLVKLRKDLNAPASSWDFDAAGLRFVPKGYKPPAAQPTATAATKAAAKPAAAAAN